ncbi:MAG: hypothetical protein MI924_11325 [Chloroflexales bacterium]|nr:hypothetical protein [Chloroflexales bacterium]
MTTTAHDASISWCRYDPNMPADLFGIGLLLRQTNLIIVATTGPEPIRVALDAVLRARGPPARFVLPIGQADVTAWPPQTMPRRAPAARDAWWIGSPTCPSRCAIYR